MASIKKRDNGKWRARYRDDARQGACAALRAQGRRPALAGRADGQARQRACTSAPTAGPDDGGGVVRHLAGGLPREPARRPCGRPRSTSPAYGLRSGRCRSARCGRRTSGPGRAARGRGPGRVLRLRAARAALADLRRRGARRPRSQVAVLAADLARRQASSGPTSRRLSRSGRCTTRCPSTCGRRSCSARSRACGWPRHAGCGWLTWTSCAASSSPAVQYPAEPLKTETSRTPVPIPQSLALELSAHVARWQAPTVLVNESGDSSAPWTLERAMRVGASQGARACRRTSASTTCGTTSPRCSSRAAPT